VILLLCWASNSLISSLSNGYAEYDWAVKIGEHSLSIIPSMLDKSLAFVATIEVGIRHNLGKAYMGLGKYSMAKDNLYKPVLGSRCTEHEPVILGSLGSLYQCQGDIATALRYFQRALRTSPPWCLTFSFEYLVQLGECLFTAGDLDEALSYLEQALTLYQNMESTPRYDADLYFRLARVWFEKGNNRKCLDYLTKAEAACTIRSIEAPNHPIISIVTSLRSRLDFSFLSVSRFSPSTLSDPSCHHTMSLSYLL